MKINKVERIKRTGQQDVLLVEADGIINMTVPINEDNKDYRELKKQEREGKIEIKERVIAEREV